MEWRLTAKLAFVVFKDRGHIEGGNGVREEVDEVALEEPFLRQGWEKVGLVVGPIALGLAHATLKASKDDCGIGPPHYSKVRG